MPLEPPILESYKHFVVFRIENRAFVEFAGLDSFVLEYSLEVEEPIWTSKGNIFPLSPSVQPHRPSGTGWLAGECCCFSIRKAGPLLAAPNLSDFFSPIFHFHMGDTSQEESSKPEFIWRMLSLVGNTLSILHHCPPYLVRGPYAQVLRQMHPKASDLTEQGTFLLSS